MDLEKLINHYPDLDERKYLRQVWDKVKQAAVNEKLFVTPFLDPRHQYLAIQVIRLFPELAYRVHGGYPEAERNRIYCWPEAWSQPKLRGIGFVRLSGNFSLVEVTHRDFLGAILNLGIKREKVGDIILLPGGGGAQVVLDEEVVNFVISNLTAVHRVRVTVEEISEDTLLYHPPQTKEISGTVPSLRLDAIASLGFGYSRSKIVPLIKGERVRVNWRPVCNPSYPVKEGDIISLAGRGRIVVEGLVGESRKGRKRISLKKVL